MRSVVVRTAATLVFFLIVGTVAARAEDPLVGQLRCLRDAVYTEARGEPQEAQLMVAYVVYHRAGGDRSKFCQVVYEQQRKKDGSLVSQFSGPVHHPVTLSDDDPDLLPASIVAVHVGLGHFLPPKKLRCVWNYENKQTADAKRSAWFKTLHYAVTEGRQSFYCPSTIKTASR